MTVVAIPLQKALLMCPYVSSGKFSVLAPCCSRALLHNLQLTSDRCLIFASHLATGMIPAIAIISCLLFLARLLVLAFTSTIMTNQNSTPKKLEILFNTQKRKKECRWTRRGGAHDGVDAPKETVL